LLPGVGQASPMLKGRLRSRDEVLLPLAGAMRSPLERDSKSYRVPFLTSGSDPFSLNTVTSRFEEYPPLPPRPL